MIRKRHVVHTSIRYYDALAMLVELKVPARRQARAKDP